MDLALGGTLLEIFPYGEREVEHLARRDRRLGAAIERIGHIDRPVWGDIFSSLISCIVSQQISTKAARTVWARFVDALGSVTPEALAALSVDEIQGFSVSFRKAAYIKGAADAAVSGELDVAALPSLSDGELIKRLAALDGVGAWTAEMLMLFSLRRPNVLSAGDLAIHRGMIALYGPRCAGPSGKRVDAKFFEGRRKRWSPFGSVASLYLWAIAGGAGGYAIDDRSPR